jgi:hypothetical protein
MKLRSPSSDAYGELGARTAAKRCRCGWPATRQCDWTAEASGEMRCDAAICARCTLEVAPDRDLCPKHAGLHRDQERGRPL